jgi:hypothetical protein
VEQKERPATDRTVGKRDSADSTTPGRPIADHTDHTFAGDRPGPTQEGGLLRELRETPRPLD